jgi:tetratricopeptide (TPR) repeat protein
MRSIMLTTIAVLALSVSAGAFAAGGGGGGSTENAPAKVVDPNYASAKKMIDAKNYAGAMPLLQQVVAKNPKDADAYTLMGYATRKSGDANGSLQYYNTALGIDPKHIGAHEYVGEAYLQLDKLPEAEQHLARLDSLCVFGCAEYRDLKAAVAAYKTGKKPTN